MAPQVPITHPFLILYVTKMYVRTGGLECSFRGLNNFKQNVFLNKLSYLQISVSQFTRQI